MNEKKLNNIKRTLSAMDYDYWSTAAELSGKIEKIIKAYCKKIEKLSIDYVVLLYQVSETKYNGYGQLIESSKEPDEVIEELEDSIKFILKSQLEEAAVSEKKLKEELKKVFDFCESIKDVYEPNKQKEALKKINFVLPKQKKRSEDNDNIAS